MMVNKQKQEHVEVPRHVVEQNPRLPSLILDYAGYYICCLQKSLFEEFWKEDLTKNIVLSELVFVSLFQRKHEELLTLTQRKLKDGDALHPLAGHISQYMDNASKMYWLSRHKLCGSRTPSILSFSAKGIQRISWRTGARCQNDVTVDPHSNDWSCFKANEDHSCWEKSTH